MTEFTAENTMLFTTWQIQRRMLLRFVHTSSPRSEPMPVLRSQFSVEQFEEALQRFAHEQPKFRKVITDLYTIEFRIW